MVSNYALLAVAVGIVQTAKTLPTPFRELLLVGVCIGALLGSTIMQQSEKKRGSGPPPPKGWRWLHDRGAKEDDSSSDASKDHSPEVLAYQGDEVKLSKDSLGIAIVPGNPGIPHFYCQFGEQLHKALRAEGTGPAAIYAVGYPNFATTTAATIEAQGVAPIDDEAVAISAVLDELAERHSRGLILIGHSIGSWIVVQHLLRKSQPGDDQDPKHLKSVPLALLAMPFLEVSSNFKQSLLSCLVGLPLLGGIVRTAALALLALPLWARAWIMRLMVGKDAGEAREEVATTTFFDQPHHAAGVLLMLKSELRLLNPAVTPGAGFEALKPLLQAPGRPPVVGLYTRGDCWGPEAHAKRLEDMLGKGDEVVDLGSSDLVQRCGGKPPPHDFVMDDACLGPMAELVAKHVSSRIGGGTRR